MATGTFIVLKKFKYGSVSDLKRMIPSDVPTSAANYSEEDLAKWESNGWIKWTR